MTELTRSEILENRKKAVAFLQKPHLRKAVAALDKGNSSRCCLGHMCYALGVERQTYHSSYYTYGKNKEGFFAPVELIEQVGLRNRMGSLGTGSEFKVSGFTTFSLADLNDKERISPQRIGAYLESVIEGGEGTPFLPLSDYPE